jgi:hypothetical protein
MGQFKPMVKMYTDEPSVILKLKKGGNVKAKAGHADGFKSMSHTSGGNPFAAAESGRAPKKPSMAERRRAMNPNQYAKGGKVAHKYDGGMMGAPAGVPMAPMGRASLAAMAPAARAARAAMVRRALMGMKKGGSAAAQCAKLERELKHHESLSAAKAHGKASGGEIDAAETRTTLKGNVKEYAKTKMDTAKRDTAHGTGEVKEGKPGGFKRGGKAHKYAMGGTIEGNEGKFENTYVVDGDHADTAHGTGGVRMGNAGGFKRGGKMHHKAKGGSVPGLTSATVEGGNWENRPANTAKPGKKNTTTGEVKESNAGGFKKGGAAKKAYATGGNVVDDGKAVKMPRHFVSQPVANSLQSGTFKRGGKVKMADGGSSKDASLWTKAAPTLKDKYMRVNEPVNPNYSETAVNKAIASSNRSGRKIGGKEAKAIHALLKGRYADGGKVPSDIADQLQTRQNQRAYEEYERGRTEENQKDKEMVPQFFRDIGNKVREVFTSPKPPAGSVTKTEKSVTVAPRKRGGSAMC